jgi:hypothetical protein
MKTAFSILIILLIMLLSNAQAKQDETYVSFDAWEIGVDRVNNKVFRWILFHPDSDFPCLRIENLESGTHKLINRRDICSIYDKELQITHNFKQLSFLDIHNLKVSDARLLFDAELSLLSDSVVFIHCAVNILDDGFSDPDCNRVISKD